MRNVFVYLNEKENLDIVSKNMHYRTNFNRQKYTRIWQNVDYFIINFSWKIHPLFSGDMLINYWLKQLLIMETNVIGHAIKKDS